MSTTSTRPPQERTSLRTLLLSGLVVCLLVAAGISFYASSNPDGLEYVAGELGFIETAQDPVTAESPLADYGTAGVQDERLSVGIAGLVGVLVTGVIAFALMWAVRGRSRRSHEG